MLCEERKLYNQRVILFVSLKKIKIKRYIRDLYKGVKLIENRGVDQYYQNKIQESGFFGGGRGVGCGGF